MFQQETKTWRKAVLVLVGMSISWATAVSAHGATYNDGFIWDRSADWVPGAIDGSTAGNPAVDSQGSPVWQYELVQGDEFGGQNPWYQGTPVLLSADTAWFQNVVRNVVWSAGDDVLPAINELALYHLSKDTGGVYGVWEDMPLVRWLNPTGETISLAVVGELTVGWRHAGVASLPVDVAIARANANAGTATLLYSATVGNPGGDGELSLPISIAAQMEPDDSLIITHRASGMLDGTYVAMLDDVQLVKMATIVPEPATLAVLALGGGVALVRRRRRRA